MFYQPGVVEQWQDQQASDRAVAEEGEEYVAYNPIRAQLASFLDGRSDARNQPLKGHPIQRILTARRDDLANSAGVATEAFRVDSSIGSGDWAQVVPTLPERAPEQIAAEVYP